MSGKELLHLFELCVESCRIPLKATQALTAVLVIVCEYERFRF